MKLQQIAGRAEHSERRVRNALLRALKVPQGIPLMPLMLLGYILATWGLWNHDVAAAAAAPTRPVTSLRTAAVAYQTRAPLRPDTFVHLFEWKWTDVAQECVNVLGPAGVDAVQVSPVQEHRVMQGFPWYQRYQPVSYRLESRGGTREEFVSMVRRCDEAGVKVIVDIVINHMAETIKNGQPGRGHAGTPYDRYSFPGLWSPWDFHHCGRYGDDVIQNYQDRWEVQNCELLGLSDLDTGSEYVRARLAKFMDELLDLGVAGFRIDAAKHISTDDIRAILNKVTGAPYVFQEVIDQGDEPITSGEYMQNGSVTEFRVSLEMARVFRGGKLAWLSTFGESWGLLPGDKAVAFTDNHDNQRGHGGGGNVLTFRDQALHDLGNAFLLAWPYGTVSVMSSYAFNRDSDGPPSDGQGRTKPVYDNGRARCSGEWICEHRREILLGMFRFRAGLTSADTVNNWWTNGNNAIAFARGRKGFVVLNREGDALTQALQTNLPPGRYCDQISGGMTRDKSCRGTEVRVDANGFASVSVPAMGALAIDVSAKASDLAPQGTALDLSVRTMTNFGQSLFVVGNLPELGAWDPNRALGLSSDAYPVWTRRLFLPPGVDIEYKYLKKDGQGNIVWESGANRTLDPLDAQGAVRQIEDSWP